MARFTLRKDQKLKSSKLIDRLFSEGASVTAFPLKLLFVEAPLPKQVQLQVGFSVPKRNFKLAVTRNRLKRLLREAYRLNEPLFFNKTETSYAFMFLYLAKEERDFQQLNEAMQQLLQAFLNKITHEEKND